MGTFFPRRKFSQRLHGNIGIELPEPMRLVLCSFCLLASHGHELSDNQVLLQEALLPALQGLELLLVQVLECVKRSIEILGEHVLVEAAKGQPSACIASSKVGIGTSRTIEVSARCDVKNSATNGKIDGHSIKAIVWKELRRGKGPEDGRRRGAGEGLGLCGPEPEVHEEDEEREQEEVDWREDGCSVVELVEGSASSNKMGNGLRFGGWRGCCSCGTVSWKPAAQCHGTYCLPFL